jgi:hypothetical protein
VRDLPEWRVFLDPVCYMLDILFSDSLMKQFCQLRAIPCRCLRI